MNFIKIICNSFEERDFIHKQGCIVNERKCKGRYECWKCPFATCNISFEVKDNKMLSYCQGDGLNVYGTLNLKDVLYNLSITPLTSFKPEDSFTEKEKRTLCCYAKECGWEITLPQNYRYAYCMVDRIDLAEEWEYILTEITPPFKNLNKKLMKRFQQYIVDLFTKFCAELEAAGYQFFYSIDDESMENVCKTNEWEFLEDGTLFK